jgi:hypothetical protein
MHFLVIDSRFQVPVFVFLELDPRGPGAKPGLIVHGVTLELVEADRRRAHPGGAVVCPQVAIGQDPDRLDRFVEFLSDRHVRAAGFTLIEPRYVGPSWESYLSVFRPEGERRTKGPVPQPGTAAGRRTQKVPAGGRQRSPGRARSSCPTDAPEI